MQTITEYRNGCRVILGDEGARRYSDSMLDMGIREALNVYRSFCPLKEYVTATVTKTIGGGTYAVIPWLFGPDVEILGFRKKSTGEDFDPAYTLREGTVELVTRWGYLTVGDELEVTISGRHMIKGLDDAKMTTIPDGHALTVQSGASGYAMRIRARSVTEVFGKRPEDREALSSQANRLIADYQKELKGISRNESYRNDPW